MNIGNNIFNLVKRRALQNPQKILYHIIKNDGSNSFISYAELYNKALEYDEYLSKVFSNICVVYHGIDLDLLAFLLAAFKNNVKVIIRRTSLIEKNILLDDISKLNKTLPVEMAFLDEEYQLLDGIRVFKGFYKIKNSLGKNNFDDNKENNRTEWDFIQYSSGSTDLAQAFCLNFNSLITSANQIIDLQHINADSQCLSYLTWAHIYGFVTGFILPILNDVYCICLSTEIVSRHPEIVLDIITQYKITHLSVVISTLEKALDKKKNWNLSSLICASLGGEKVQAEVYSRLQLLLQKYSMSPTALTNSYGMSEKGAITMEDCKSGNTILTLKTNQIGIDLIKCESKNSESRNKISLKQFVSVGKIHYKDEINIKIFDERGVPISTEKIGKIGIASPYLALYYFKNRKLNKLKKIKYKNEEYYFNGDCGFHYNGQLYVTGRTKHTIVFNGLKISGDEIGLFIKKMFIAQGIEIGYCIVFNEPHKTNKLVCYIDYSNEIIKNIYSKINIAVLKKYHVFISDFFIYPYKTDGIGKFRLKEIINLYEQNNVKPNKKIDSAKTKKE